MKNYKLNSLKYVAAILAAFTQISLGGCGKKAECDVKDYHAHMYTNEEGYVRYIDKEYLSHEGYNRHEDYIVIDGQEALYKFLDKKDLMRINDNLELVKKTMETQEDYMEYRYRYTYMSPIPHFRKIGKVTSVYYTYIPITRHSWTSNPNHSRLTGETRMCHYVYVAYKIEKNEKGKFVLIPSKQVDDITTVMDEYPYIKKTYYKVVTLDGKDADYEDGKQEDLSDEEKRRAEEYDKNNKESITAQAQAFRDENDLHPKKHIIKIMKKF